MKKILSSKLKKKKKKKKRKIKFFIEEKEHLLTCLDLKEICENSMKNLLSK